MDDREIKKFVLSSVEREVANAFTETRYRKPQSVAVLAGLGSFGLNKLVITDAGCAGRFASLLLKAKLTTGVTEPKERCLYFYDGTHRECIKSCPVNAIKENMEFDRAACYRYVMEVDAFFRDLPLTDVCGKCSVGLPCSLRSAVRSKRP